MNKETLQTHLYLGASSSCFFFFTFTFPVAVASYRRLNFTVENCRGRYGQEMEVAAYPEIHGSFSHLGLFPKTHSKFQIKVPHSTWS